MTRDEFLAELDELGLSQAEFAFLVHRTPETVCRWGKLWKVPRYVASFIEAYKEVGKAKVLQFALDSNSKCPNGHELEAWLQIRNNCIVCGFCGAIVRRNIYPQGE